ncbi:hypothetical protein [Alteriqipengyuania lutimaris]|uniref:hypothetical protein n=1 Tax=Alteriqipengyuania lutimaris TaxID=1538146 RepID=UPI001CFDA8FC|nr:hypothetical protein [Alteriqipengyuania lutimaris]
MRRPLSISLLAGYLIVVFGISLLANIYGAVESIPPYVSSTWMLLAIPKILALAAGIAFLKMLKLGAYLWFGSVVLGWVMAVALNTGFFPNFGFAAAVSLLIVAFSAWVIWKNWPILKPASKPLTDNEAVA